MRKILLISILCLFVMQGFAQLPKIGVYYPDGNKCAVPGGMWANVQFVDETPGSPTGRDWLVREKNSPTPIITSQSQTFHYLFTSPGDYWAVINVNFNGTWRKDSVLITIHPMPVFSISKSTDSICPRESIQFSFTMIPLADTGKLANINWDFGDGLRSNLLNPNHLYANPNNYEINYNVSLAITDINGCVAIVDSSEFVYVRSKPEVFFTPSGYFFCFDKAPEEATVNFTNKTDTARYWATNTYSWNFGDGNTSTQTNPSHTYHYDSNGTNRYFPTLIATDQYNCTDSFMLPTYIRLNKIVMNYTHTPLPICQIPDTLKAEGKDNSYTYYWKISNPNFVPFRPLDNSSVEYRFRNATDTGTYTLVVTQYHRQDASCQASDTIVFNVYNLPVTMTVTDTNECDPDHPITFRNATAHLWAGVTNWHFGNTRTDGGATTAQGDSIVYTYNTTSNSLLPNGDKGGGYGDYRVMMTRTMPHGCPTDTVFQDLHIFRMHAVASVINPTSPNSPHGCAPLYVELYNEIDSLSSSSSITSAVWRWDNTGVWNVNDTILGITDTASHLYTDTGKYTVVLTLTNTQGCRQDIQVANIMVGHPPITNFTFVPDTNCLSSLNIQVMAYDSLTGGTLEANAWANEWQWLDDNNIPVGAATETSTIFPNEAGEVVVKLASFHNGCPSVAQVRKVGLGLAYPHSIPDFISSKDNINFDNGKDTICRNVNEIVYFQDNSWSPYPFDTAEITEWRWSIAGLVDTTQNPSIQIATYGLHDLKMSITNEYGCSSEKEFEDQVLANFIRPAITFQNNKKDYCNKELVLLTNATQILPSEFNVGQTYLQYHWDFGDGTDTTIYEYAKMNNQDKHSILHSYNLPNTTNKVYIKLTVSIIDSLTLLPIGCEAEITDSITINRPIAKFSADSTRFPCPDATPGGVQGRTIIFTEECEPIDENSLILTWNFGDTASGVRNSILPYVPNGGAVTHTYENAGTYSVTLVAEQNFGVFSCRDTMFMESLIDIAGPQGELTYSPHGGCRSLQVFFYPTVSYDPIYKPDSMIVYPGTGDKLEIRLNREWTPYTYRDGGAYLPTYYLYKTVTFNGQQQVCVIQRTSEDSIYVIDLNLSFETEEQYVTEEDITFVNTSTWIPDYLPYDSILWEFNNVNVSYMYDGNTQYSVPGSYYVTLTMRISVADTFCVQKRTIEIEVVDSLETNIPVFEKEQIKIYPNPTSGELYIEFGNDQQRHIQIVDMNGRVLYKETHDEQNVQLSLEHYASGTYTIVIDNINYKKFIITR